MFNYTDQYKAPSAVMIDSVFESLKDPPIFVLPGFYLYECKPILYEFLKDQFDGCDSFGILKVFSTNNIHTDINRDIVFNYVIETGGPNVETVFWDSINGMRQIQRVKIEPHRWCRLEVSIPHSIESIVSNRIIISVWKKIIKNF